jgi:hypothetical protein
MHRCLTDLRHVPSGAVGHRVDYEAKAPQPERTELLVPNTMQPYEPCIIPNGNSPIPAAG